MALEPPKTIGRYRVERWLASGAMGNVFLAHDPDLARAVAIKTVRDHGLDARALANYLARFKNEARAAAKLHHPNIVAIYDVGEDPNVGPYLVFEYVSGASLKALIENRGPLDAPTLLSIAEQIARALDAAHAASVIHRDIKPENILVTSDGHAKLADFGVARLPDAALTRDGQFLGTPCYAAPETLTNSQYSPQSDLFSFAAVLYEAASAERAFPGDDAVAVAHHVVNDEPPAPSEVAPRARILESVDKIILQGLRKNPNERWTSAAQLARALRAAYEEQNLVENARDDAPTLDGPSPLRTSVAPKKEISTTGVFAAVVLGGLAVGVALILALAKSDEPLEPEIADAGVAVDAGRTAPIVVGPRRNRNSPENGARNALSNADASSGIVVVRIADAGPRIMDAGTHEAQATPAPETATRDQ